jgi:hypothetical protein
VVPKETARKQRKRAGVQARLRPEPGMDANGLRCERRKNEDGFPVRVANRQRIVGALAASGRSCPEQQKKGRREAGLSVEKRSREDQYFATIGPPK